MYEFVFKTRIITDKSLYRLLNLKYKRCLVYRYQLLYNTETLKMGYKIAQGAVSSIIKNVEPGIQILNLPLAFANYQTFS